MPEKRFSRDWNEVDMSTDYEKFEKEQNMMREVNKAYLAGFEEWLKDKGLSKKTVDNHINNVDFYINEFLLYYDVLDVKQGCYNISSFLGDWFIRKTLWSSCAHIKSVAASVKKFYAFMFESDVIEQKDYDALCETIKEEMPDWLDEMKRYEKMDGGDYY